MLSGKVDHGVTPGQRLLQCLGLGYIAKLIKFGKMLTPLFIHDGQHQVVTRTQTLNQTRSDKAGTPDDRYFTLIHNLSLSPVYPLFPTTPLRQDANSR
ncbi:hypothetical protein D3C80_674870 [compost metagenome]